MMTISFKNGKEIQVSDSVANIIRDRILSNNANDFQTFSESIDKNLILTVRLSEIVCITKV